MAPLSGSAAIAARDRPTFVRLDRHIDRRCPRDGTRREERGLLRMSGSRLGPRCDDVEK
jgi:hypothetical protein